MQDGYFANCCCIVSFMTSIEVFNQTVTLDYDNKGIKYFLAEMCMPIDESTLTYDYWQTLLGINDNATIDDSSRMLRNMDVMELKRVVLDFIIHTLNDYEFSQDYAKYVC